MKSDFRFLRWIYGLFLNFYPRTYLEEYGEELQAVFNLSIEDTTEMGKFGAVCLVVRELMSLSRAAFIEHLRERRKAKMIRRLGPCFQFTPGSISETLAALMPFLFLLLLFSGIPALLTVFDEVPIWLVNATGFFMVGWFLVLLVIGLVKGLRRWSLPYVGVLLSILSVYEFSKLATRYYGYYDFFDYSSALAEFLAQAYIWYGLIGVTILLIMAAAALPAFRRFKADWTLISFLVYGAAPIAVFLAFDEYRFKEPYVLWIFLVQALAVWFYLRSSGHWKRFLILFAGLTSSLWLAGAVTMWVWLALCLLLPTSLSLFSRQEETEQPV